MAANRKKKERRQIKEHIVIKLKIDEEKYKCQIKIYNSFAKVLNKPWTISLPFALFLKMYKGIPRIVSEDP